MKKVFLSAIIAASCCMMSNTAIYAQNWGTVVPDISAGANFIGPPPTLNDDWQVGKNAPPLDFDEKALPDKSSSSSDNQKGLNWQQKGNGEFGPPPPSQNNQRGEKGKHVNNGYSIQPPQKQDAVKDSTKKVLHPQKTENVLKTKHQTTSK